MRLIFVSIFLVLINLSGFSNETDVFTTQNIEVSLPEIIVKGVQQSIDIRITDKELADSFKDKEVNVIISGTGIKAKVKNGVITIPYTFDKKELLD